jgi:hypothetical protein
MGDLLGLRDAEIGQFLRRIVDGSHGSSLRVTG